jgi:hypothetical protein
MTRDPYRLAIAFLVLGILGLIAILVLAFTDHATAGDLVRSSWGKLATVLRSSWG